MTERFIVKNIEDVGAEPNYQITDTNDGWFYLAHSEREARFLVEKLNALVSKSNNTIEDYFNEWEKSINELSQKEIELVNLKEVYSEKEQEILTTTDFKELYGANNEKIRKNHIKKTLQAMTDAKQELEISIEYLKRRIDFIRNLMSMQRTLIEVGVIE